MRKHACNRTPVQCMDFSCINYNVINLSLMRYFINNLNINFFNPAKPAQNTHRQES